MPHFGHSRSWLKCPQSKREQDDNRLLSKIKQYWMESGFVYGHRNITLDLKDEGETCGNNRVYRKMKGAGIKSLRGYKRHRGFSSGKTHHVANNLLNREFSVTEPNKYWVTDFTYILIHQGWLYLTIVIDLFSRKVIGWSMKKDPRADLVIDALLMAIWRRKPKQKVLIHSDQLVQYTCKDWQTFANANNLEVSMSRRGNCHDNAVAESFFSNLKKERIKRHIYRTRNEAKADIFNYIEFFYNPKRRHGTNERISPKQYEEIYFEKMKTV